MRCCRITERALWAIVVALVGAGPVLAADYHVDALSGNDAYTGTQGTVRGDDGPWQTLARAAQAPLQPGDRLLLKCGAVWRESVTFTWKGTAQAPIVIASYGACAEARPLVLAKSTSLKPAQFSRTTYGWAASVSGLPEMVVVAGNVFPRARFPAQGWLLARAFGQGITANPADLPMPTDELVGSDLFVRTNDYTIEQRRLLSVDVHRNMVVDRPFQFRPVDGVGFALEGAPWIVSTGAGWAYDRQSRRLHLSDKPSAPVEVIASRDPAIRLVRSEHLRIESLGVRFIAGDGIEMKDSRHIALADIDITDVRESFVRLTKSDDVSLHRLVARRSQVNGIVTVGGQGLSLTASQLEEVGTSQDLRKSIAAVFVDATLDARIIGNRIHRAGYAAIMFGKQAVVEGNIITQACLRLADCGAIYTSGARKNYGHYGSVVSRNIIVSVPGDSRGTVLRDPLTAGVYLDDESQGIKVLDNHVEGAQRGIFSKATEALITGNTLYNNRWGVMLNQEREAPALRPTVQIDKNVIISFPGQMPMLVLLSEVAAPINVARNDAHVIAGALPSEQWRRALKLADAPAPDPQPIRAAFSYFNAASTAYRLPCPAPSGPCRNYFLLDGSVVEWPLVVAPGAVAVGIEGRSP